MTAPRAKRAPATPDQLIDTHQLSEYLQVPEETVKRWRKQSPVAGPPFIKVGRGVRYDLRDVAQWLKQNTVGAS